MRASDFIYMHPRFQPHCGGDWTIQAHVDVRLDGPVTRQGTVIIRLCAIHLQSMLYK